MSKVVTPSVWPSHWLQLYPSFTPQLPSFIDTPLTRSEVHPNSQNSITSHVQRCLHHFWWFLHFLVSSYSSDVCLHSSPPLPCNSF
jgi:hypothetical protein